MITYWDLSERERSELSAEDVEKYAAAELMLKGVLKVPPLVLAEEKPAPLPTVTCYRITSREGYVTHESDIAFDTRELAEAVVARGGLWRVATDWMAGANVTYLVPLEPRVVSMDMPDASAVEQHRAAIEAANAAKAANEKARSEHAAALKKQTQALAGLWENWHRCVALAREMRLVVDTFDEYVRLAGDESVALKFLRRAFSDESITEAFAWFGRAVPVMPSREELIDTPSGDPQRGEGRDGINAAKAADDEVAF